MSQMTINRKNNSPLLTLFNENVNPKHIYSELSHISSETDDISTILQEIEENTDDITINSIKDITQYLECSPRKLQKTISVDSINSRIFKWKNKYILDFNQLIQNNSNEISTRLQNILNKSIFEQQNSSNKENSDNYTSLKSCISALSHENSDNIQKIQNFINESMLSKVNNTYLTDFSHIIKETTKCKTNISYLYNEVDNMTKLLQKLDEKDEFDYEEIQNENKNENSYIFTNLEEKLKINDTKTSNFHKKMSETIKQIEEDLKEKENYITSYENSLLNLSGKIEEILEETKVIEKKIYSLLNETKEIQRQNDKGKTEFEINQIYRKFHLEFNIFLEELKQMRNKLKPIESYLET